MQMFPSSHSFFNNSSPILFSLFFPSGPSHGNRLVPILFFQVVWPFSDRFFREGVNHLKKYNNSKEKEICYCETYLT